MIGTIRKHSKWLWAVIITATIISFLGWNINSRMNGGNGRSASGDFGSVYGRKITQQQFVDAVNEFKLVYLFQRGNWPDKNANMSQDEMERQAYIRLLIIQKADDLGIQVGLDAAAAMANQMLRKFGRDGLDVSMADFAKQVLSPEGLTVTDFENFTRHEIALQQLMEVIGMSGALVPPQEITGIYQREHQELSSQIVFFSATNYLSQVVATPGAVGTFYTNYLAAYRLPDRVQVNYVEFNLTNFLAQSKAEWAKTNLEEMVSAYYQQNVRQFADAKTPEEAKAKVRELFIQERAMIDARAQANDFASTVFNVATVSAENLATVAKQKGLAARTTAPFAAETGPQEFAAPDGFAKTAFGLTADEPFANPILGKDAIYVIALAKQLPSEIPLLADIRARVMQDYKFQAARQLALRAGTNFSISLKVTMAVGGSFASACISAGLQPQVLPPFSLVTRELPELGDHAELSQVKQAAFTTGIGHASPFVETGDGGFTLFVQSQLPVDQSVMDAALPQFTADLRRSRASEAFNEWLNGQIPTQFGNLKIFQRDAMK